MGRHGDAVFEYSCHWSCDRKILKLAVWSWAVPSLPRRWVAGGTHRLRLESLGPWLWRWEQGKSLAFFEPLFSQLWSLLLMDLGAAALVAQGPGWVEGGTTCQHWRWPRWHLQELTLFAVIPIFVSLKGKHRNFCFVWTSRKWGVDPAGVFSPLPLSLSPCSGATQGC